LDYVTKGGDMLQTIKEKRREAIYPQGIAPVKEVFKIE
jgi:hypothetical protein